MKIKKQIISIILSILALATSTCAMIGTISLNRLKVSDTTELHFTLMGVKTTPEEDGCFVQLMVEECDTIFRQPMFCEAAMDEKMMKELKPGEKISLRIKNESLGQLDEFPETEFLELKTEKGTVLAFEQVKELQNRGLLPMQIFIGVIEAASVLWLVRSVCALRAKKIRGDNV